MTNLRRTATALAALLLGAMVLAGPAQAARIGVLSNKLAAETAADFSAKVSGHTFTGVDLSLSVPTVASLTAAYDAILLFEDSTFANSPIVGANVAAFAQTGRAVILGTFYEQDRSDALVANSPHGWGALKRWTPTPPTASARRPFPARSTSRRSCPIR